MRCTKASARWRGSCKAICLVAWYEWRPGDGEELCWLSDFTSWSTSNTPTSVRMASGTMAWTRILIVDAYTKRMEAYITNTSTAQITIDKMRSALAVLGLPGQVVMDNRLAFKCEEFKEFLQCNGLDIARPLLIICCQMAWLKKQCKHWSQVSRGWRKEVWKPT